MPAAVVVHGFETSNNTKVRVALGYKALPYEFRTIDPAHREEILRISGQHLTPVLVHGDRVVFDSAAIIRYLETAFPDAPGLLGSSRGEQWEIEDWEFFARATLAGPMMAVIHSRANNTPLDDAATAACSERFREALSTITSRMAGREWLVGNRMSVADINVACIVQRVRNVALFPYPSQADSLLPWVEKVLSFDGPCRVE